MRTVAPRASATRRSMLSEWPSYPGGFGGMRERARLTIPARATATLMALLIVASSRWCRPVVGRNTVVHRGPPLHGSIH